MLVCDETRLHLDIFALVFLARQVEEAVLPVVNLMILLSLTFLLEVDLMAVMSHTIWVVLIVFLSIDPYTEVHLVIDHQLHIHRVGKLIEVGLEQPAQIVKVRLSLFSLPQKMVSHVYQDIYLLDRLKPEDTQPVDVYSHVLFYFLFCRLIRHLSLNIFSSLLEKEEQAVAWSGYWVSKLLRELFIVHSVL